MTTRRLTRIVSIDTTFYSSVFNRQSMATAHFIVLEFDRWKSTHSQSFTYTVNTKYLFSLQLHYTLDIEAVASPRPKNFIKATAVYIEESRQPLQLKCSKWIQFFHPCKFLPDLAPKGVPPKFYYICGYKQLQQIYFKRSLT